MTDMRCPPPPLPICFRTMEIQLTDFENAAFTVFVVLLTRIILAFDLHLYIPISKVGSEQELTRHLSDTSTNAQHHP